MHEPFQTGVIAKGELIIDLTEYLQNRPLLIEKNIYVI